ncbi:hypothetical protein BLOT_005876 [Blomia tropicalis]|nr:hypothetical protein BLOT_005876 [Blomia tropicalis]
MENTNKRNYIFDADELTRHWVHCYFNGLLTGTGYYYKTIFTGVRLRSNETTLQRTNDARQLDESVPVTESATIYPSILQMFQSNSI